MWYYHPKLVKIIKIIGNTLQDFLIGDIIQIIKKTLKLKNNNYLREGEG